MEPQEMMSAAVADYEEVKSLLQETGLPYFVTPGGEDCIQAFKLVFGVEPSAQEVYSRMPDGMQTEQYDVNEYHERCINEDSWQESSSTPGDDLTGYEASRAAISGMDDLEDTGNGGGCCGGGKQGQESERSSWFESGKRKILKDPEDNETKAFAEAPKWTTPAEETSSKLLMARFCDFIPSHGSPRRLEYERRLFEGLLSENAPKLAQCHVHSFPIASSSSGSAGPPGQEDGSSRQDGLQYFEHESLLNDISRSNKFVLSLSSLSVEQSKSGLQVHTHATGRATFVETPSLAVFPHVFSMHNLSTSDLSSISR
ncbi:hypothetical protein GUITHDRAFT_109573 [Guillardia theta CCMP2712]|uniref:Uncharacterized protein n=1 Tax=Guillardia theta (strain CCMP2712) TaxID=905079 RepID=L1J8Q8_GUITC|nr:hypothetical protein GUITHDRAFT_109573 [Guillardia theta CCMP2712]EKX44450.1 hypothetical protein GUITHDRAFT_109573 [Guillardia theta CCMP2712]|eukprot:XP_005831430.1 hypothetical protein GUITHDRAFT_109573 [Guillardia theta CCMP2712]